MDFKLRRICVPADFNDASHAAIEYAAELTKVHQAELHILHVLEDFGTIESHPEVATDGATARRYFNEAELQMAMSEPDEVDENDPAYQFLHPLREHVERHLELAADKVDFPAGDLVQSARYGHPVEEICDYARDHEIDLLVMATHGRSGLKHLLMGSVTERVLRSSPCAVLVLRPE